MRVLTWLFICGVFGALVPLSFPNAQDSELPRLDFRIQDETRDLSKPLAPYEFVLRGYEPLNFKNLSQLYWKSGVVKTDNVDAVTEYLQINECAIYESTFKDDFVWPDVLKSTTDYLEKNRRLFLSHFTLVQPIALDRYNTEKGWFVVTPDTQYLNVTSLVLGDYPTVETSCGGTRVYPKTVPRQAQIKLGHPFSLTYLRMKPDFARQYIEYMEKQTKKVDIGGIIRPRFAYIKFYYTITGLEANKTNREAAYFLGTMDGYVIFADSEETMPIAEWISPKLKEETPTPQIPSNGLNSLF